MQDHQAGEIDRGPPAGGRPRSGGPVFWALVLGGLFAVYTLAYLGTGALPGNPEAPLGWWGWFDQGQYIASARAFADGSWRGVQHFYPPLYPWLGSWFVDVWPAHPFFLVDFAGLALHVAALLVVGRRLFGAAAAWLAVVATGLLFPVLTLQQWETPWTTSLTSGIGAVLLLVFCRFADRGWRVSRAADWAQVGLNSLAFGSIAAVRPLDALVWLPEALAFYGLLGLRNADPRRPDVSLSRTVALATLVVCAGLAVPACYVYFNVVTSGSVLGTYILQNSNNGYQLHGLVRKAVSLLFDSRTVYVESGQAIADRFWPLYLALPLLLHGLIRGPALLRVLTVTIALQYLVYIPYADLLPNGMFRYFNVHYFTWTFPWLVMLCLGFLQALTRVRTRTPRLLAIDAGAAVLAGLCLLASLRAFPVGRASAVKAADHAVTAELDAPQRVDMVDFTGLSGGFTDIYFGANTLTVDGQTLREIADFRLLPTERGLRLVLPRALIGQRFVLGLDPKISIDRDILSARAEGVGLSFQCRIEDCGLAPLVPPLPLVAEPTTIDFAKGARANAFFEDGWAEDEAWGRWSSASDAHLAFKIGVSRDVAVSVEVQPLLAAGRPDQTVWLTANECPVASVTFSLPDHAATASLGGTVPASCVPPDGRISLDIATDRTVTPKSIGIGEDDRALGVGLRALMIH